MSDTKLKAKMKEKGITNKEMASKLSAFNVREETIFQWADGRRVPSARDKKALAKMLCCKVSDIF